jgi:hypothetical protein
LQKKASKPKKDDKAPPSKAGGIDADDGLDDETFQGMMAGDDLD